MSSSNPTTYTSTGSTPTIVSRPTPTIASIPTIVTMPTPTQTNEIRIPVAAQINKGTYTSAFHENSNTHFDSRQYSTTHYVETPPESYELQRCWQYGKTVKCLACIDSFFCILNALTLWPMIFIAMMPICGYYGAKLYDKTKTSVYLAYCICLIIGRVSQLDNIYHHRYDENPNDKVYSDGSKFLVIISIFIQIWITWIVGKFIKFLYSLDNTQLSTLRVGTYVPVVTSVLYY